MQTVPKNSIIYFGHRKWVEGDILPPFLQIKEDKKEPEYPVKKISKKKTDEGWKI